MRKPLAVLGLLVVAGLIGLAAYDMVFRFVWVGGFDLTVDVVVTGEPPEKIIYSCIHRRVGADAIAEALSQGERRPSDAVPFGERPGTVHVMTCGSDSGFGRPRSYAQEYQFLVVAAEWPDGRRVVRVVEIPDGRVSRTVRVEFR